MKIKKILLLLPFLFLAITRCENPKKRRRRNLDRKIVKSERRPSYRLYRKLCSLLYKKLPYRLYRKRPSYRQCRKLSSALYKMIKIAVTIQFIIICFFITSYVRSLIFYNSIKNKPYRLHLAAKRGNLIIFKRLVAESEDIENAINAEDGRGLTPLRIAADCGCLYIVKELLAYGANVNAKTIDEYGDTPLHAACWNGHLSIVKELLAYGANVNAKTIDEYGDTPLHAACWNGHLSIVKELLANRAEVNAKTTNKVQQTPLFHACYRGHLSIVKELLANRAEVNVKDGNGNTPLDFACYRGYLSIVKELLVRGAEVDVEDENGKTPLVFARAGKSEARGEKSIEEFTKIIECLLKERGGLTSKTNNLPMRG